MGTLAVDQSKPTAGEFCCDMLRGWHLRVPVLLILCLDDSSTF